MSITQIAHVFVLWLLLLNLNACSYDADVVERPNTKNLADKHIISVVNHGWHTGFVIPAQPITDRHQQLKQRFVNKPYLEFGWGDKGFYQADQITIGLIIPAILWPTDSVMHVVALPELPQAYFPHSEVLDICLTDQSFNALLNFITDSFYQTDKEQIISLQKGIYGDSQFYKGAGDYHLMNTCNKWTAEGLKSAGMDVYPGFKLTASSVMDFIRGEVGGSFVEHGVSNRCF